MSRGGRFFNRNRGGRFSTKRLPPGINIKKDSDDGEKLECCEIIGTLDWYGNNNLNQLAMHVCVFLGYVNDIHKKNLNLNNIIASSQEIFKCKSSFTIEKFNNLEFSFDNGTNISLVYKIFGLTKVEPYEPYSDLTFQVVSDKNDLVNIFNKWYSIGYHNNTILQWSNNIFAITKVNTDLDSNTPFHLFDPNVKGNLSPNEKYTCEIYKCATLLNLIEAILECINRKQTDSNNGTCCLIGVGTLKPLTKLELYVTNQEDYDKKRVAKDLALSAYVFLKLQNST